MLIFLPPVVTEIIAAGYSRRKAERLRGGDRHHAQIDRGVTGANELEAVASGWQVTRQEEGLGIADNLTGRPTRGGIAPFHRVPKPARLAGTHEAQCQFRHLWGRLLRLPEEDDRKRLACP